jgi:FAD/FMN-containing dehydrogenase
MPESWSNWSGCVSCAPERIETPRSEAEVAQAVKRAALERRTLRVVGSGHSQTPLVATDGVVLSLDALAGISALDVGAREAQILAGTKLCDLGEPLLDQGLAMENLGDVDVQALGGALATGTHGTGQGLRNLSSAVSRLRLVTAGGDLVEWNEADHAATLAAARVSLGALGVVTEVGLRLVPAQRLHERVQRTAVEEVLRDLDARIAAHRHFEFFWYPSRDRVDAKSIDATDALPDSVRDRRYERIDWSSRVLPSVRTERFVEMEYSLPAESGAAVFSELRQRIRARHPELQWPVEYRTVAADDAWLSPAGGRATVTISVHQDARLPFLDLFRDLEPVFAEAGGRPHWGKWHGLGASQLCDLYPQWQRFHALRDELDPGGVFLNEHLRHLFFD